MRDTMLGDMLTVMLITALLVGTIAVFGMQSHTCTRALDRSHTAADSATVYRLGVCPKEGR